MKALVSLLFKVTVSGGVLVGAIGWYLDWKSKSDSSWEKIDLQIHQLILVILEADPLLELAPDFTSPRLQKIKFVRELQSRSHATRWLNFSAQLPELSAASDTVTWKSAIRVHSKIEELEHPREYTDLLMRAQWRAVAAKSYPSSLSGKLLQLVSEPSSNCGDCLLNRKLSQDLKASFQNNPPKLMEGIAVEKLPYKGFESDYPVFKIDQNLNSKRFLIPSYQSIQEMKASVDSDVD